MCTLKSDEIIPGTHNRILYITVVAVIIYWMNTVKFDGKSRETIRTT